MMNYSTKIHFTPLILILILTVISQLSLYSLSGGNFTPWCVRQMIHTGIGIIAFIISSLIDFKLWKKFAFPLYIAALIGLFLVEIVGKIAMGAQRWLSIGSFAVQPSEFVKLPLILAISKYFSSINIEDIKKSKFIIWPICLTFIPVGLVLLQPDLGTAMLLILILFSMLFAAGISIRKLALAPLGVLLCTPFIWSHLHEYQKNRVLMFLVPESDPNGAGYHIIQSKIALGSGGIFGKGFMHGTQCQLNFLPEKHTDFIFAAIGEEFGFLGCAFIMFIYILLLIYNYNLAFQAKTKFAKFVIFGINSMLFSYIFINIAMVCGLLPIVGVPLPFLSYGGTALAVLMMSQGVIISAHNSNQK